MSYIKGMGEADIDRVRDYYVANYVAASLARLEYEAMERFRASVPHLRKCLTADAKALATNRVKESQEMTGVGTFWVELDLTINVHTAGRVSCPLALVDKEYASSFASVRGCEYPNGVTVAEENGVVLVGGEARREYEPDLDGAVHIKTLRHSNLEGVFLDAIKILESLSFVKGSESLPFEIQGWTALKEAVIHKMEKGDFKYESSSNLFEDDGYKLEDYVLYSLKLDRMPERVADSY